MPLGAGTLAPRLRGALAAALAAVLLWVGVLAVNGAIADSNDFQSFWRAGRDLWSEGAPSEESGVERYLPVFQALHVPLGWLPVGVAAGIWYALSVAALAALPREIERLSGVPPREQLPAFAVLFLLALDNLKLGQSAPVLIWLVSFGLARARRGGAVRGGFALGAAALFKVLPAALLGVPVILHRARGALAGFALAVALGFAATAGLAGVAVTLDATRRWASETREEQSSWGLVEHERSLRFNNQGLGVVLARTFGDLGERKAKGAVRLASWPFPVVWTLYGATLALLFAAGVRAALAARRLADARAWLELYALSALGMLLAAPLVWTHYFLWLLPALVAVRAERRLLLWGGIAFNAALAVRPLRALGFHMLCALALYLWLARGLWRAAGAAAPAALARGDRGALEGVA
jgi:hypothetical protein